MKRSFMKRLFGGKEKNQTENPSRPRNLTDAEINRPYVIKGIAAEEQGMKEFLCTLGCFEGETVTVISASNENYIIHVKNARYSIDSELAGAILIQANDLGGPFRMEKEGKEDEDAHCTCRKSKQRQNNLIQRHHREN
ncbi:FeoA-like protein [Trichococcus patagoniensis]|uniref:FeoA-like protein n=1 Tax=Trichococcus patagoniensis TaxID=382641 RepID=A0A2T5IQ12_9LACT|nr:FeoA family protein [Trichococcus patagoniensis]PTQ85914.1 FeoA-like protein [Trichococcus patagoniensis]